MQLQKFACTCVEKPKGSAVVLLPETYESMLHNYFFGLLIMFNCFSDVALCQGAGRSSLRAQHHRTEPLNQPCKVVDTLY